MHDQNNVIIVPITSNLQENIDAYEVIFDKCADVVKRKFTIGEDNTVDIYLSYIDLLIDRDLLEEHTIESLVRNTNHIPPNEQFEYIYNHGFQTADVAILYTMEDIVQAVLSGDAILMVENSKLAIKVAIRGYPGRGVSEADTEVTIRGAKDSFTESMAINKVLIRRRIRDSKLKVEQVKVGLRSRTDIGIMYISDIAEDNLVKDIKDRLAQFDIDGVLDSGMIEQLTEGQWNSPFPQYQSSIRPDKIASGILEGRIAVLVDNSPYVLLLPTTVNSFFQAADDYYTRWEIASFTRLLRYIAAIISIVLPGLYIAIANYQSEMIPTSLVLSLAAAREGVPFTVVWEVIIMEIAFELLKEAGIRLPGPMGSTIGIIGGLIIGDAAVSANIVSPIIVIIVALTAVASFAIPNETFATAFRITRYLLIILSAWFGIYGLISGIVITLIHLSSLESFGIPYLMPFVASGMEGGEDSRDGLIRFPTKKLYKRPIYSKQEEKIRFKQKE